MKSASPCALFDMKRCGAPCVGKESSDSYSTHVLTTRVALQQDANRLIETINDRMFHLAGKERFEEAQSYETDSVRLLGHRQKSKNSLINQSP